MKTAPDRFATMTRLTELMQTHDLLYLRVRQGDFAVELTLPSAMRAAELVSSPAAGTAHFRHASQDVPLVEVGKAVVAGQVVALVANGPLYEAVRAPRDGVVARLCKADGELVTIGEPLLSLA